MVGRRRCSLASSALHQTVSHLCRGVSKAQMPEPSHLSLPPTLGDGSFIPRHTQSRRKQGSRHGSEHFTAALSPSSWLPCPASLQAPRLEKQVPGPPMQ